MKVSKQKRQALKQSTIEKLRSFGLVCRFGTQGAIEIVHNRGIVLYYPSKQWFTGRTVKDGRGWDNLISQLKGIEKKNVDTFKGKSRGYAVGKNDLSKYWIVDRDEFRTKGKVFNPILITDNIEDARMKIVHYPNAVITKTIYITFENTIRIKYQQIVR